MPKGAVSSLAFASSAVASGSLGYVFVSTAPLATPEFKVGAPQAKPKKFQLFGTDARAGTTLGKGGGGRRRGSGRRKLTRYIAAPTRGQQHPVILKSDRLDEDADAPDPYVVGDATGGKLVSGQRERRVHSAPPQTLLLLEQRMGKAQTDGEPQQGRQPGPTLQESRTPPSQKPLPQENDHVQADSPAGQAAPRSPGSRDLHLRGSDPEPRGGGAGAAARRGQEEDDRANGDEAEDDDNESDWDEGITATTPRPLRCASIAFPPEATLSAEKRLELAAEFEKSVQPCENWDEDFDIDVETQALQVPSAVAAAQFSVRMDLHNIHDFAKQIEALKSLRTEVQDVTKAIANVDETTTKVDSLQYAYASDWEQAEIIIKLGEIAHDEKDEGEEEEEEEAGGCGGDCASGQPPPLSPAGKAASAAAAKATAALRAASAARAAATEGRNDDEGEGEAEGAEDDGDDEEEDLARVFGSARLRDQQQQQQRRRRRRRRNSNDGGGGGGNNRDHHLSVLKNILLDGLSPDAQRSMQPFLDGNSVQFSVEMVPGLLAHLKNVTGRLETYLAELRALRAA